MLTAESLAKRISDWSARLRERPPAPGRSSIFLYQAVFGLLHDLKTSVHLSEDPMVRERTKRILACEAIARKLAFDELEFEAKAETRYFLCATGADALNALADFLGEAAAAAHPTPSENPPVVQPGQSWESLSRARARSCARHGYSFYERVDSLKLRDLVEHDSRVTKDLESIGGIAITHHLEPQSQSSPGSEPRDLPLHVRRLDAFPAGSSPPEPWRPL